MWIDYRTFDGDQDDAIGVPLQPQSRSHPGAEADRRDYVRRLDARLCTDPQDLFPAEDLRPAARLHLSEYFVGVHLLVQSGRAGGRLADVGQPALVLVRLR